MALSTALHIKNTKENGWYSISGAKGLYLRICKGKKTYYFRYQCLEKRKTLVIAPCEALTLSEARQKAIELGQLLREGIDPSQQRKEKLKESRAIATKEKKKEEVLFKNIAKKFVRERALNGYWKNNIKGERDTLSRLSNHVFPVIGDMDINSLKPENIRDVMLPIWNRSPSTSSKVLSDIRAVFRWAIALNYRTESSNPADLHGSLGVLLEPYNKNRKLEETYASIDFKEIPSFVKDISSLISPSSEMLLLSIYLAARSKAIRNMKWEDIDFREGVIHIRKNIQRVQNAGGGDAKTTIIVQAPKTVDSVRIVPIPPVLFPLLEKNRREFSCYVVRGQKHPWADPRTVQYRFKGILEKCGLEYFNFHMLRHAFATRCIAKGFDIKSLSEILGHSDTRLTMNLYVHSTVQQKKKLMNRFDTCLYQEK